MIETTYIRISTAAEMLQTNVDTLLIAAAELNFSLYWLINRNLEVEEGYHREDGDEHGFHYTWNPIGITETRLLMYIPLSNRDAAELLKAEVITGSPVGIVEGDLDGSWTLRNTDGLSHGDLQISRNAVFALRRDIERYIELRNQTSDTEIGHTTQVAETSHVSKRLALMNEAAARFWRNADRTDRGTHPVNKVVADWFALRGLSKSQAESAASLIRPEWAPSGRPPEE